MQAVHTIRDHPNHERPLNGGLWGGTKGAISGMTGLVKGFSNKQGYGGDLQVRWRSRVGHVHGHKRWPGVDM